MTARTAVLWDLDNIMCRRAHLDELATDLRDAAGPSAVLVAAGRRDLYRAIAAPLRALGFEVRSGGRLRNGADRVLLERARSLHAELGVSRFVVVSHDHVFVHLPADAEVVVISPVPAFVSMRLRDRASAVLHMPLPGLGAAV